MRTIVRSIFLGIGVTILVELFGWKIAMAVACVALSLMPDED